MLQLVSMVAMEPPESFTTESVRDRKAEVFRQLRPIGLDTIPGSVVLGQYGPGEMSGAPAAGYRQEPGVSPGSTTPTFAAMKLFIDSPRWQGVPFFLTSGKRMARKSTSITIQFREPAGSVFGPAIMTGAAPNRLTFSIQPREAITLAVQAKNPGPVMCLRPIELGFRYEDGGGTVLDAYEKVLLDCLGGEQMLCLRQDSEELCWAFLTPLVEDCSRCMKTERILYPYPAGSAGPPEAARIRS
jgi:glucose-6-phosphate 1-dehydrogenase